MPIKQRFQSFPAIPAMKRYLQIAIPGRSLAAARLREDLLDFACNPLADRLLIRGSSGAGKSALARSAAFLKGIAMYRADKAEQAVTDLRFSGPGLIDPLLMPWFVELSLTGLVDSLAAAQLFGTAKGAITGVEARAGVFEQAAHGRMRGEPPLGALITGGVVFLDEIGDLSNTLQPQLLPVLSGGMVYRVGAEGSEEYGYTFSGIAIAATWRNLERLNFRPDLLSRIAGTVITVPDLSDRGEDIDDVLSGLQASFLKAISEKTTKLMRLDARVVDRGAVDLIANAPYALSDSDRRALRNVDWAKFGNLRALRRATEQVLLGRPVQEAIGALEPMSQSEQPDGDVAEQMLNELLNRRAVDGGLVAQVKEIEFTRRVALQELLRSKESAVLRLAAKTGISERHLKEQMHQLTRRRTRGSE